MYKCFPLIKLRLHRIFCKFFVYVSIYSARLRTNAQVVVDILGGVIFTEEVSFHYNSKLFQPPLQIPFSSLLSLLLRNYEVGSHDHLRPFM